MPRDGGWAGAQVQMLTPGREGCAGRGLDSQRGEGLQGVEGTGGDGGDLVVVKREEADVAQAREAVVVDAADAVVPQHPGAGGRAHAVPWAICPRGALATTGAFTDWPREALSPSTCAPSRPSASAVPSSASGPHGLTAALSFTPPVPGASPLPGHAPPHHQTFLKPNLSCPLQPKPSVASKLPTELC